MKLKYTALIAFAASMFFVACETETPAEEAAEERGDAIEEAADEVEEATD